MKLVASLIVRNELDRYLEPCIDHLLEFCEEIRVLNDGSTDGSDEWLVKRDHRIHVCDLLNTTFFDHEGHARQVLLDWTLETQPSHVLAIDADEFVGDGEAIRYELVRGYGPWTLCMEEVWNADPDGLDIRQDGGWEEHDVAVVWRVDRAPRPRIADRQLACGRIPVSLRGGSCVPTPILHFGWTNQEERQARYDRYAVADGGRFHQSAHLDSILAPPDEVKLTRADWPDELAPWKDAILARANR